MGDVIVELGGAPVEIWSDLTRATQRCPAAKPAGMVILRNGVKKKLSIAPRVAMAFDVAIKMTFKGWLVFDTGGGKTIRMEMAPIVTSSTRWSGQREAHERTELTAVIQLQE